MLQEDGKKCEIHLLETEYIKMATESLISNLGIISKAWSSKTSIAKVVEYEELLKEENQRRKTSIVITTKIGHN